MSRDVQPEEGKRERISDEQMLDVLGVVDVVI